MADQVVIRGPQNVVDVFRAELQAFLVGQPARSDMVVPQPAQVAPDGGELSPHGHEVWMQLAMDMGQAVAVGLMTAVVKDLVIEWIKARAKEMGLWIHTSEA